MHSSHLQKDVGFASGDVDKLALRQNFKNFLKIILNKLVSKIPSDTDLGIDRYQRMKEYLSEFLDRQAELIYQLIRENFPIDIPNSFNFGSQTTLTEVLQNPLKFFEHEIEDASHKINEIVEDQSIIENNTSKNTRKDLGENIWKTVYSKYMNDDQSQRGRIHREVRLTAKDIFKELKNTNTTGQKVICVQACHSDAAAQTLDSIDVPTDMILFTLMNKEEELTSSNNGTEITDFARSSIKDTIINMIVSMIGGVRSTRHPALYYKNKESGIHSWNFDEAIKKLPDLEKSLQEITAEKKAFIENYIAVKSGAFLGLLSDIGRISTSYELSTEDQQKLDRILKILNQKMFLFGRDRHLK